MAERVVNVRVAHRVVGLAVAVVINLHETSGHMLGFELNTSAGEALGCLP
jgi:hypothetical protein